jgi:hypothetical protein
MYLGAANQINFATASTSRLTINSTGALSIATPTGSSVAFTVNGYAGVVATAYFKAANSLNNGYGIRVDAGTGSSDYNFLWMSAAGTEYGRVTGDGKFQWQNAAYTAVNAIGNSGSTCTVNCALSNVHTVTLNANCTFAAPTNPNAGQTIVVLITQGASWTVAFNAVFLFPYSGTPVATTGASTKDMLVATYNGSSWLASYTNAYG